ncbi:hypothetical protein PA7_25050 [Pseudonocardia asaccharolytica DSM 44247 = NBRC 16224]|uniref:Protein CR006 P-loop domain-containing protein n=1 Tax=Pseudonocardia asaccharolytica DSM 44247 = NBRC 16224 TaxID=1123024 RepID=A0A511D6T5_9PSEU|nr:hypothetical protein PA7_25050 [Pseudonocardia asaccharolytica DSM 44247 = NBRC 16224]
MDGAPAGALGVLSTGELHALTFALFIPRATRPESPFRFIVLDDPIQAMDPSKIDAFVEVLADLAETRQVVVFSHDDRLPQAGRERPDPGGRPLGQLRRLDQQCTRPLPSRRPGRVRAVGRSGSTPEIIRRVLPWLCRSAVETAARDVYFARSLSAGRERHEVESTWNKARNQRQRLALALHGDPEKSIDRWIGAKPWRRAALTVAGPKVHSGLTSDPKGAVRDVERLVDDLRAEAR